MRRFLLTIGSLFLFGTQANADEIIVAVAANFAEAARDMAERFGQQTGHRVILSVGSTGGLYARITQGAPYHVFLAADAVRPILAERNKLAVPKTRFTYAVGRLVLWSRDPSLIKDGARFLKSGRLSRLAIANPKTAPYGVAAVDALNGLGVYDTLKSRLIRGSNVAQAFQFVATGNAQAGLVARSLIGPQSGGSRWEVPSHLHEPIAQQAVLLTHGVDEPAAESFLAFLQSPTARAIGRRHGFEME